jgi:predicted Zn-dependent peptidase
MMESRRFILPLNPEDVMWVKVQTSVLGNGLTVITEHNEAAVSTYLSFYVRAGGHYETDFPYGIAHFLEHMMFMGTTVRTKEQIRDEMDDCGGQMNAVTYPDHTRYYTTTPYYQWKKGADILSDMLFRSIFPEEELQRERRVVLEEIKRAQDDPMKYGGRLLMEKLRANHPERAGSLGTPETVSAIMRDDLLNYKDRYYHPGNMTLTVTGNIVHEELVDFLQTVTPSNEKKAADALAPLQPCVLTGETIHVPKDIKQAHLHWGMYGPCSDSSERAVSQLAVKILSSRLKKIIRGKKGVSYSVGASTSTMLSEGFILGFAGTDPGKVDEAKATVIGELNRLREEDVSEEELARMKNSLVGSYFIAQDNSGSRNWRLAYRNMYGVDVSPERFMREIGQLESEAVREFAGRYFDSKRMLFVQVGGAAIS